MTEADRESYLIRRKLIAEEAMRTWQEKYDLEHEAHQATRAALERERAALALARDGLFVAVNMLARDVWLAQGDEGFRAIQTVGRAYAKSRATIAATEERDA